MTTRSCTIVWNLKTFSNSCVALFLSWLTQSVCWCVQWTGQGSNLKVTKPLFSFSERNSVLHVCGSLWCSWPFDPLLPPPFAAFNSFFSPLCIFHPPKYCFPFHCLGFFSTWPTWIALHCLVGITRGRIGPTLLLLTCSEGSLFTFLYLAFCI